MTALSFACPDRRPIRQVRQDSFVAGQLAPLIMLAIVSMTPGCGSSSSVPEQEPSAAFQGKNDRSEETSQTVAEYGPQEQAVCIETSLGAITIKLDVNKAPGTVHNFLNYISSGFYDDTLFHYVAPGNMILGGGYSVGHRPKPPTLPPLWSEAHNGRKNLRGTIAMTRDAATVDSATTQFFINLADAPQRDHTGDSPAEYGYCVFGEVVKGMDVADQIGATATQDRGGELAQSPEPPVVVKTIRIL